MKRLWISSMEDSAIREGFANLRPGADYDGLHQAALCRAKADWLVGINATRLYSCCTTGPQHRRVMSPTLALIIQREAEIDTFKPCRSTQSRWSCRFFRFRGAHGRQGRRPAAENGLPGCGCHGEKGGRKDKSEKPPALYDLTTLQRDANRCWVSPPQQTLDYLQSLYEKKLCTYPRTDSRHLTSIWWRVCRSWSGSLAGRCPLQLVWSCLQCGPGHQ